MAQAPDRHMIVSADCHAGASLWDYKPYLERRWHDEFDAWAASYRDEWLEIDPGPDAVRTEDALKVGAASGAMAVNWDNARRIRDLEGDGIAAVHLPRLTVRFYRVDAARSRQLGGTGLGLAIVKHVVNRHRGRLDIQSTPGKGSTFTVTLPAAG